MSALLEPEEDTLIWSAWVFLKELSLTVLILHTNAICSLYIHDKDNQTFLIKTSYAGLFMLDQDCGSNHERCLQDLQDKLFSIEDATAPRVWRTGTGINWRLQVTRKLVALKD